MTVYLYKEAILLFFSIEYVSKLIDKLSLGSFIIENIFFLPSLQAGYFGCS